MVRASEVWCLCVAAYFEDSAWLLRWDLSNRSCLASSVATTISATGRLRMYGVLVHCLDCLDSELLCASSMGSYKKKDMVPVFWKGTAGLTGTL